MLQLLSSGAGTHGDAAAAAGGEPVGTAEPPKVAHGPNLATLDRTPRGRAGLGLAGPPQFGHPRNAAPDEVMTANGDRAHLRRPATFPPPRFAFRSVSNPIGVRLGSLGSMGW